MKIKGKLYTYQASRSRLVSLHTQHGDNFFSSGGFCTFTLSPLSDFMAGKEEPILIKSEQ